MPACNHGRRLAQGIRGCAFCSCSAAKLGSSMMLPTLPGPARSWDQLIKPSRGPSACRRLCTEQRNHSWLLFPGSRFAGHVTLKVFCFGVIPVWRPTSCSGSIGLTSKTSIRTRTQPTLTCCNGSSTSLSACWVMRKLVAWRIKFVQRAQTFQVEVIAQLFVQRVPHLHQIASRACSATSSHPATRACHVGSLKT